MILLLGNNLCKNFLFKKKQDLVSRKHLLEVFFLMAPLHNLFSAVFTMHEFLGNCPTTLFP